MSALLAHLLPAGPAPDAGAGGMAGSTAAVSGGTPTAEGAKPDTIVVKPAEMEPPHLLKSIRASTGLQPSPGYEVHWYAFE